MEKASKREPEAHADSAAGATVAGVARAAFLKQVRNLGRRIWRNPARMFAPSVPPLKIVQDRAKRQEQQQQKPGLRSLFRELWSRGVCVNITHAVPLQVAHFFVFNRCSRFMP